MEVRRNHAERRYKKGDEMRSANAADAEDRDYEQRLLKVVTERGEDMKAWGGEEGWIAADDFDISLHCAQVARLVEQAEEKKRLLEQVQMPRVSCTALLTIALPCSAIGAVKRRRWAKFLNTRCCMRNIALVAAAHCGGEQVDRRIADQREVVNYESEAERRAENVRVQRESCVAPFAQVLFVTTRQVHGAHHGAASAPLPREADDRQLSQAARCSVTVRDLMVSTEAGSGVQACEQPRR